MEIGTEIFKETGFRLMKRVMKHNTEGHQSSVGIESQFAVSDTL